MPRRVEDIIRNDRRSIRDVAIEKSQEEAAHRKGPLPKADKGYVVPIHRINKVTPPPPLEVKKKKKAGKGPWKYIFIIIGSLVLFTGVGYASSKYFSRATFTVVPVVVPIKVDTTILATSTTTPNYVRYEIAKFKGNSLSTVAAKSGAVVATKSTGKVTLYNSYSTASQRLIAGTRFSSEDGHIYRLPGSVVIPGYTVSKGVTTPGKLVTTIQADQAGADYDLSKVQDISDLKIVAYKGGPRYDTVYARLSTDIIGGFSGVKKIVDPKLQASTTAIIQADLTAKLLAQAKAAVPEGYIMYDGSYDTSFSIPAIGGTDPNLATITVDGTLYAIMFKKDDLVRKIAGADKIAAFGGLPYKSDGLSSLSFSIAKPSSFSGAKANTLIARMKGDMTVSGVVPVEELKKKLAGKPLSDTGPILDQYRPIIDISKSSGALFPSWARVVPTDISRISIVIEGQ